MLKLTKKGDKYWLFEDSEIGLFSPSKFTINLELNEIVIVYENGLRSKRYNVIDCEIYDLGATSPFTTSNGDLFMQKLEELNCPCFQKNENIYNISGGAWGDITGALSNQTDLQTALDLKLDKDTTAGVERTYIINADGSQDTKATSEFKDVLEFADFASFPTTGETGIIYVALDTNFTYRWSGSVYVQIGGGIKGFHRFQSPNFSPAANTTYYIGGNNIGLLGSAQTSNFYARVKAMVTGKIGKVSFFASAGLATGVGANVYLDNITKGTSLTIANNFIWTSSGAVNFISTSDFLVDKGDELTIRLKIGGDGTGGGGGTNNNFWAELTIE